MHDIPALVHVVLRDAGPALSKKIEVLECENSDGSTWLKGAAGDLSEVVVDAALSHPEALAAAADMVQDFLLEELPAMGRPAVWPECPLHPGRHPLRSGIDSSGQAAWQCPKDAHFSILIGKLEAELPGDQMTRN